MKHLVHAFGAERGSEDASDGFTGGDVGLLSIETSQSALLLLLLQDEERPSVLVESQRHDSVTITIPISVSRLEKKKKEEKSVEAAQVCDARTQALARSVSLYLCFPPFSRCFNYYGLVRDGNKDRANTYIGLIFLGWVGTLHRSNFTMLFKCCCSNKN